MQTYQKNILILIINLFIVCSVFGITCQADDSSFLFHNKYETPVKKEVQASEIKFDFDSPVLLNQKHQSSVRLIYNKVYLVLSDPYFIKELEYFDIIEYQVLCHKWQFILSAINPVRAPTLYSDFR